jgi:hypothetical protein
MDYDYGYSYAGAMGAIVAIYLGILLVTLLFLAAYYVLMAIALSTFFKKVGVEGWIAWVPIYNHWKWLEVGGQPGWLSLLSLVPGGSYVTLVFLYIGMYRTGKAFGKDGSFVVLGIFLPFVWAFMLGGRSSGEYHPEWFASYGWPPPYAGYGSVPAAARQPAYPQQGYPQQQYPQQPPTEQPATQQPPTQQPPTA